MCEEMSKTNKCWNLTCDTTLGKCVESKQKVTCPPKTSCRPQSQCNPATGTCDIVEVTPADCKNRFKKEAKANHTGDSSPKEKWFETNDGVDIYYNCGEHRCDVDAPNPSANPEMDQNGYCIFTPGDNMTCGACSGQYPGQETFDTCEGNATEMHNANKDTCYTSTCIAKSVETSACNYTEIHCEHKPCMEVICNQATLQCEYTWTDEYLNLQKNVTSCNELRCVDDTPVLIDISKSKCVGENNQSIPVCMIYDHCDPDFGCIYDEKCKSNNGCIIATCDEQENECNFTRKVCDDSENICYKNECIESTGKCEAVIIPLDIACEPPDLCHMLSCDVIQSKCVYEQIPYPNKTDLCHIYICNGTTGEWTVKEKCDDGDICTVDSCTSYDGSCTNFKRDCHEINMTGFGSCFGRSCSKLRKNGCFRKVYENSYFDECGNCIRGYSAEDSGVTDSEVSDCKKALSFPEEAAVISAGVLAGIIAACIVGAAAVSTAGTIATAELIKRARAAQHNGARDNPLFEPDGTEMDNPTFVGNN